jgi:hypothetical protein
VRLKYYQTEEFVGIRNTNNKQTFNFTTPIPPMVRNPSERTRTGTKKKWSYKKFMKTIKKQKRSIEEKTAEQAKKTAAGKCVNDKLAFRL